MSKDFLESVLPNPELSDNEDLPELILAWSSCFGGANFLMFTTLSTILVPTTTGLSPSPSMKRDLLKAWVELWLLWAIPAEALPLEGVLDCLFDFPLLLAVSREDDLEFGAPALVLDAEAGLSGNDVFKFGGASSENPGICEGSQGLDFTDEEVPRDWSGFFTCAGRAFVTDEDREGGADTPFALDGVDERRVGVDDLRVFLEGAKEGLAVGVEARAVDLVPVGVDDLTGGPDGLEEVDVARYVGVEGLEDLAVEGIVGLPDGVTDLKVEDVGPPDDDGLLLLLVVEEPRPGVAAAWFLEDTLLLEAGSDWILTICHTRYNIKFQI